MLRTEKVSKSFLRKRGESNVLWAVQETDLTLEAGKVTVLSGPSGSGKSTLLNLLSGILKPTGGKVWMDDVDLYAMNDAALSKFRNAHIGVIPQGQTALHSLTVLENVLLPTEMYHLRRDADKIREEAMELLRLTGIADLANVMPSELSGGEMRRMAVARALINQPDVILADEPTADLDDENTAIVLGLLRHAAQTGKTVFVVTHDRNVTDIADVSCIMNNGQFQFKG